MLNKLSLRSAEIQSLDINHPLCGNRYNTRTHSMIHTQYDLYLRIAYLISIYNTKSKRATQTLFSMNWDSKNFNETSRNHINIKLFNFYYVISIISNSNIANFTTF